MFTALALFFAFSKYLTPDTPIGNTNLWYSTFFFLTGIFLFNACGWILDFIHIKKWNKFDLYCSGLTMYLSIALTIQLIPYWIRTINGITVGFLLMDLLTGLIYSIGVTLIIVYLKVKIIPKQRDVQKFIYINGILANGLSDEVLNASYLGEHHLEKQLKDNASKIGDKVMVLVEYDVIKKSYRTIHDRTTRLVRMNEIADQDD